MTYLPSLIKKIDDFYRLTDLSVGLKRTAQNWKPYVSPEEDEEAPDTDRGGSDEGLYPLVMDKIHQVSNEGNDYEYGDITSQIAFIAALYKKAIEINGGYKQVLNRLKLAVADIYSCIDESDGEIGENIRDFSEELLDDMKRDLIERSKANPAQQMNDTAAIAALKNVENPLLIQEARAEITSQKSEYERGKPGQETSHTVKGVVAILKKPEEYVQEIKDLQYDLQSEKDENKQRDINSLIIVLAKLVRQMGETTKLKDAVRDTPEDEGKKKELATATEELDNLRKERNTLKQRLNKLTLKREQNKLLQQFQSTRDEREKAWLKEKVDLLEYRLNSKVLRKRDAIKARKAKINFMGVVDDHQDFQPLKINETERIALERTIQLGEDKTITKADYDRERTEQKARLEGRETPDVRKSQRGGWAPGEKQHRVDTASYQQLMTKVRHGYNTAVAGTTYYITRAKETGIENGYKELEKYIEAISAAIRRKDRSAQYSAQVALREATRNYIFRKNPQAVASYEIALRLRPFVIKMSEDLNTISSWQQEGQWKLTEEQKQFVRNVDMYISRFIEIFNAEYGEKRSNFNSYVNNTLAEVKLYLERVILGEKYDARRRIAPQPETRTRVAPSEVTAEVELINLDTAEVIRTRLTVSQIEMFKNLGRQISLKGKDEKGAPIFTIKVREGDLEGGAVEEQIPAAKQFRIQSILRRLQILQKVAR